jgi:hypothetical protein
LTLPAFEALDTNHLLAILCQAMYQWPDTVPTEDRSLTLVAWVSLRPDTKFTSIQLQTDVAGARLQSWLHALNVRSIIDIDA